MGDFVCFLFGDMNPFQILIRIWLFFLSTLMKLDPPKSRYYLECVEKDLSGAMPGKVLLNEKGHPIDRK